MSYTVSRYALRRTHTRQEERPMTTTTLPPEAERLLRTTPGLERAEWLEGTGDFIPELGELHEQHVEAIQQMAIARQGVADLRDKFEVEDEALQNAHRTGAKLPAMTPEEERQKLLKDARAKSRVARETFIEVVLRAVATIREKSGDWLADLESADSKADKKVREARKVLAEAELASARANRIAMWVRKSALPHTPTMGTPLSNFGMTVENEYGGTRIPLNEDGSRQDRPFTPQKIVKEDK
jgi:hypothetical protein